MKLVVTTLTALWIASPASAFDRATMDALRTCHDQLWSVPEFQNLPNAAISVFPQSENGNTFVVNWNVNWDEPTVRAAGNCTVTDGEVVGFEDYTKPD